MDAAHHRMFAVLNAAVMPWWLAMIVAPRSRTTARLVARMPVALGALGVTYGGLIARGLGTGGIDFSDAEAVRALLQAPDGFLAGWTHYLAFDLFVGRWIWRTALDEGRGCRVALTLTLMFGPLGLTWFAAQRRVRPAPG